MNMQAASNDIRRDKPVQSPNAEQAGCAMQEGSGSVSFQGFSHPHPDERDQAERVHVPDVVVTRLQMRDATARLTKRYELAGDRLQKFPAPSAIDGQATVLNIPLNQLVEDVRPHECNVYGVFSDHIGASAPIKTRASARSGELTRTLDCFHFGNDPGVVLLDADPQPDSVPPVPAFNALTLLHVLEGVFPSFAEVAYLAMPSSSAGRIRHMDTREVLRESHGLHLYCAARDASDIPRFGRVLIERLWLAGFGSIAIARNGRLLERTVIDGAVFSPERIDYVVPAVLGAGLARDGVPSTSFRPGGYLNTRLLLDLSLEEQQRLNALVQAAKARARSQADAVQAAYVEERTAEMVAAGVAPQVARETAERTCTPGRHVDLYGDFRLHFARKGIVSIAEVLAQPTHFDGEALADPIEGPHYGTTTAKFFWNDGRPTAHSFAHGGVRYFLHADSAYHPDCDASAKEDAIDPLARSAFLITDKRWQDVRALVDGHRDETQPEDHATGSASRGAADLAADWPPPQPLVASIEAEEYPLDALPAGIQAAVQEAVDYLQAPAPLIAMSAVSQLSLAVQAHADVYRDEVLRSPSSVYSLVIADSGERKTQADRLFSKAVEEYQDEQDRLAKPFIDEFQAREAAWKAEQRGILDAIKQAGKTGKSCEAIKARLRELEQQKPEAPRFPKLLRMDATPEGLAKKLQNEWPSAAIVSNEAGIVFGAHGMSRDSAVRNMGLLNVFWDGSRFRADRADDERNRDVRGARLTMGLMIQEATLRAFFEQSNGLARGTGFLARFLVAWPTSTMGSRYYKPPAPGMPAVSAFNTRIRELLDRPVTFDRAGVLAPSAVLLSPAAKEAWIGFHDAVEHDLRSGGELYDIKDIAAKIADNAARLSSLFAAFEFGFDSPIPYESFEGASRVAAWSLHESRRFFGELAFPPELANAARLERWLVEYCRREHSRVVPKNHVRQYATPISLRSKQVLDAALTELESLNRIRLVRTDRRMDVFVNPEVLAGGGR